MAKFCPRSCWMPPYIILAVELSGNAFGKIVRHLSREKPKNLPGFGTIHILRQHNFELFWPTHFKRQLYWTSTNWPFSTPIHPSPFADVIYGLFFIQPGVKMIWVYLKQRKKYYDLFSNFSCMFLNPNNFFQYEF